MVRVLYIIMIAAMLLAIAGTAFAYRLILIPVGEVLPDSVYKLEYSGPLSEQARGGPTDNRWLMGYRFDYSLGKGFEIATKSGPSVTPDNPAQTSPLPGRQMSAFDLNINWQIAKETKSMPGYGMGVWNLYDADDHAKNKESFFAGAFKTFDLGWKYPIKFHVVGGTKSLNGIFGGMLIPLSKRCQAAAEWVPKPADGSSSLRTPGAKSGLAVAVGYNQTTHWRFKYANAGGDNAWGLVYTSHCGLCENVF